MPTNTRFQKHFINDNLETFQLLNVRSVKKTSNTFFWNNDLKVYIKPILQNVKDLFPIL